MRSERHAPPTFQFVSCAVNTPTRIALLLEVEAFQERMWLVVVNAQLAIPLKDESRKGDPTRSHLLVANGCGRTLPGAGTQTPFHYVLRTRPIDVHEMFYTSEQLGVYRQAAWGRMEKTTRYRR